MNSLISPTITTLEICEMMNMRHDRILRKLEGQELKGKHVKGIIEILNDNQMVAVDYFIKSTYIASNGKENTCYKVTRLGCDFLANKFNGEKGIIFTAKYVKRFHEMEEAIKAKERATIPESPTPAAGKRQIPMTKWFFSNNWKCDAIMANFGWSRKYLYHKILVELSDLYNLRDVELAYKESHGYRPEYKLDLLDFDERLANTATHYLNYLLVEEA